MTAGLVYTSPFITNKNKGLTEWQTSFLKNKMKQLNTLETN